MLDDKSQILDTFLDLVRIDSVSGEEERVSAYISAFLERLGVKIKKDAVGNIIAYVPGKGEPLLLSAHMDTVEPGRRIKPLVKDGVVYSDGKTILGADNKAGVAVILEMARVLLQNTNKNNRPLELVFTVEEETGSHGADKLELDQLRASECLTLDRSKPLGHIVVASPFIYSKQIKIKGRSAHGGSPEKGINAIQIAGRAIADLPLGRINADTTNNIGVIQGGFAHNIVPEEALIKAEARSFTDAEAKAQLDIMRSTFIKHAEEAKGEVEFERKLLCHGYRHDKNTALIQKLARLNDRFAFPNVYEEAGGGSDANALVKKGLYAVNISYGGRDAHTCQESIAIDDMNKLKEYLIAFVQA